MNTRAIAQPDRWTKTCCLEENVPILMFEFEVVNEIS